MLSSLYIHNLQYLQICNLQILLFKSSNISEHKHKSIPIALLEQDDCLKVSKYEKNEQACLYGNWLFNTQDCHLIQICA